MRTLRRTVSAALLSLSLLIAAAPAAGATTPPGPPLETPESRLDAALHCDESLDHATANPVLFVPGTTAEGGENFAWNYVAVLRAEGVPTCWVNYPYRGWRDMQVSSEYVVHAIRTMHERSGRKVSTVGHSQGGLHPVWAARFWPDIPAMLDDVISMGSPFQGSTMASLYCGVLNALPTGCQESFWQFTRGSRWSTALNAAPPPAGPAYTSLYSTTDEFATPGREASALPGAAHVGTQDVCPGRFGEHIALVVDAVVYALVRDALTHPGPADPARVDRAVCRSAFMPLDWPGLVTAVPDLLSLPVKALLESPPWTWVRAEPPLRDYAR
ncbi:hypothetical protein SAMN05421810_102805 [Amycolatopsis arida]|uniref:Triacylglycerol esterase/lipase EstA, alpha/beta hydrolase fold n=1 Tax=Amycolatopsis arida TaxID=587909 RepID=A0A1I5QXZ5_9PSEU|nr:hypothetical protein [Amycolatopsis arida]TDX99007.1 hypothetical protein CLV69_101806 [Amycolatopsis arida]SFP51174.1 hypothetical protein SAMN05421810_102805 [Amycolatopsis arida]